MWKGISSEATSRRPAMELQCSPATADTMEMELSQASLVLSRQVTLVGRCMGQRPKNNMCHAPHGLTQPISMPLRAQRRRLDRNRSIPNSGILQSPLSPASTPKTLGSWRPGRASATGSRLAGSKARPQGGQAAAGQGAGARGAPRAGQAAKGPGWHCYTGAPAGKRPILRP